MGAIRRFQYGVEEEGYSYSREKLEVGDDLVEKTTNVKAIEEAFKP